MNKKIIYKIEEIGLDFICNNLGVDFEFVCKGNNETLNKTVGFFYKDRDFLYIFLDKNHTGNADKTHILSTTGEEQYLKDVLFLIKDQFGITHFYKKH